MNFVDIGRYRSNCNPIVLRFFRYVILSSYGICVHSVTITALDYFGTDIIQFDGIFIVKTGVRLNSPLARTAKWASVKNGLTIYRGRLSTNSQQGE